jgi:hypothetical protein
MGNLLNLVFDMWDGDNPMPNGYVGSGADDNYVIIDNTLFKTNIVSIENVNYTQNFFYVITLKGTLFEYLTNNNKLTILEYLQESYTHYFLPNRVINCIKNNGLKVIFLNAHEIDPYIDKSIKLLNQYIAKHNLNPKNFYYINNDVNIKLYQNSTQVTLNNIQYLPEMITKKISEIPIKFNTNKNGKFILLHNRTPKNHRVTLLALLKKYEILNEVNWSLLDAWDKESNYDHDQVLSSKSKNKLLNELEYFKSIDIKYSDYELDLNLLNRYGNTAAATNIFTQQEYENSYINIISETYFNFPFTHITEKSFKPFYFFQLPIFVATPNFVKQLKELYGFDLYEDLINHSYDNEPNAEKRMNMIVDEIQRLITIKDEIKLYYEKNKDRIINNRKIIENIPKLNNVNKLFFNLITENNKTSLI